MDSLTLRQNAHAIWEANFRHPFVQGIGTGTLALEKFRYYLQQDYCYLIGFARFFGLAVAKGDSLPQMQTFSKVLEATLNIEMDLHRSICAEFGLSAEQLELTRPAPNCLAYVSYLLSVAYQGDILDVLAALLPCSWGYVEIGQRLKTAGLPTQPHYRKWIETYSSQEFSDLNDWLRGEFDRLAAGIYGERAARLQEIFDFSSRWEYMFWEIADQVQVWPLA